MRFIISKEGSPLTQPCDNAVWDQPSKEWTVVINTIEDLMDIQRKHGTLIVTDFAIDICRNIRGRLSPRRVL